jgi:hypothetical protein
MGQLELSYLHVLISTDQRINILEEELQDTTKNYYCYFKIQQNLINKSDFRDKYHVHFYIFYLYVIYYVILKQNFLQLLNFNSNHNFRFHILFTDMILLPMYTFHVLCNCTFFILTIIWVTEKVQVVQIPKSTIIC